MALDTEKIIADLKEASILELNDLVKAIEEEFGVSAAAPVAAAGAAAGAAAAGADGLAISLITSAMTLRSVFSSKVISLTPPS